MRMEQSLKLFHTGRVAQTEIFMKLLKQNKELSS